MLGEVRWDRFFEDLEDQLASEWEAERAALETEAERLRLSRVALRERLVVLASEAGDDVHTLDLGDDTLLRGRLTAVGADWAALRPLEGHPGLLIVPLAAVCTAAVTHRDLLRSARPPAERARAALTDRMGLGFVLRDAARRRLAVEIRLRGGRTLTGTIDRAGADHFDLAVHEPGSLRRADDVTAHRLVPFGSVAFVRMRDGDHTSFG